MIYDLYYHDDFDGRAAGAVMLAFLRSRGDDVEHFQPLNYYLIKDYLKENFFTAHRLFKGKRNPAIVVDFPFHPKVTWWFDHHGNSFRKKGWEQKFKRGLPANRAQWHHDPAYASCCGQAVAILKKQFGWTPPAHMREMVAWGDIIDGAKYRSARQVIERKEPALHISDFFDARGRTAGANKTFVTLLAEKPLATIAKRPEVQRVARQTKKNTARGMAYIKKRLAIIGRVAYIYFPNPTFANPRFTPYFLHPRVRYLVRFFKVDGQYKLSIGQNPWRAKECKIDLGKLIARYAGGGGHFVVGAAEFDTKREAEQAARDIFDYLVVNTSGTS